MKLTSTDSSDISVGFAEKDSPLFGYIKPLITAALTAAIVYFSEDTFDKKDMVQIILIFMSALGLESINVAPKSRR